MAADNSNRKTARSGARTRTSTRAKAGNRRGAAKTAAPTARTVAPAAENAGKASRQAPRGYDDIAALGKDNLDALMQCNAAVAQSVETIGNEVLSYTQAAMQEHMAQTQALLGAKTLQELIDLQSAFARERVEKAFSESAKLSEMTVKLADEAMRPLHKRVDATVQTLLRANGA